MSDNLMEKVNAPEDLGTEVSKQMAAGMTSMSFKMKGALLGVDPGGQDRRGRHRGEPVGAAADDVSSVSPSHRAEAAYALLAYNCWPAAASRSPVGVALWLSFWPQFVLTAALGLVQLAAMYVGPSLIDRFVEFIRQGGTPWEGLRLVLTLLSGKAVQTLASHHYNFQGQLLGIRIRGALSKGKVYYIAVVIMTTLSHEPLICYGLFIIVECFSFVRNQMSCWTRLSHELLLPVHRREESNDLL
jgi:hypothetical protein